MEIVLKPVSDLKPYDKNPRLNDRAVEAVAKSIKEFGFKQPLVITPEGVIIVGHTRLKAALSLGMDTVPCVVAANLTPAQIKAYRLADNRTGELAAWDFDALRGEIADLQAIDFDTSVLGWDEGALGALLASEDGGDLDKAEFAGDDDTAGRIILVYYNPEEKAKICALLHVSGEKVCYTPDEIGQ